MSDNDQVWTVAALQMGEFGLDGGAMFGVVPKPIWERAIDVDERNRMTLATNCMLLTCGGQHVIVEAGNGWNFSDKEKDIFKIDEVPSWNEALAEFDLGRDDIAHVIMSHLHFDHAAGLSVVGNDGELEPAFPKAIHHVQREQYEWATKHALRDKRNFRKEGLEPLGDGGVEVRWGEGDGELLPGIRVESVHGHTPGMQIIYVDTASETIAFVSDLMPTHAHLHIPNIMAYDLHPTDSWREKKAFLDRAIKENTTLWFYHDPQVLTAKAEKVGQRYQAKDKVALS